MQSKDELKEIIKIVRFIIMKIQLKMEIFILDIFY